MIHLFRKNGVQCTMDTDKVEPIDNLSAIKLYTIVGDDGIKVFAAPHTQSAIQYLQMKGYEWEGVKDE